jgi:hypothetical protein
MSPKWVNCFYKHCVLGFSTDVTKTQTLGKYGYAFIKCPRYICGKTALCSSKYAQLFLSNKFFKENL